MAERGSSADVYDALARARARGERVVLVTVLTVSGEAPTRPGAKIVADADGVVAGTLGCSEFDGAGAALAHDALGDRAGGTVAVRRLVSFPAAEGDRSVELFAEVHDPEPAVLVLGGGPVGRAIADVARLVGRRVTLVSPGGEASVREGVEVKADDPARYLLAAPPGSEDAVVLSDHDAGWVDECLRIALASDAAYIGMLGSRRHAPQAVRRLRASGVPAEHVARLRSPVGLDIGSRTPEEIAVAVVAEIIAVERGRAGGPLRLDWSAT